MQSSIKRAHLVPFDGPKNFKVHKLGLNLCTAVHFSLVHIFVVPNCVFMQVPRGSVETGEGLDNRDERTLPCGEL